MRYILHVTVDSPHGNPIGTFGASRLRHPRHRSCCAMPTTPAVARAAGRLRAGAGWRRASASTDTHARPPVHRAGRRARRRAERPAGDGTISRVLPGESVGEQSVLDEAANLDAIVALEDSELLVIEADLVWQLIDAAQRRRAQPAAPAVLPHPRRQRPAAPAPEAGRILPPAVDERRPDRPVQPRLAERHAAQAGRARAPGRRPRCRS